MRPTVIFAAIYSVPKLDIFYIGSDVFRISPPRGKCWGYETERCANWVSIYQLGTILRLPIRIDLVFYLTGGGKQEIFQATLPKLKIKTVCSVSFEFSHYYNLINDKHSEVPYDWVDIINF